MYLRVYQNKTCEKEYSFIWFKFANMRRLLFWGGAGNQRRLAEIIGEKPKSKNLKKGDGALPPSLNKNLDYFIKKTVVRSCDS